MYPLRLIFQPSTPGGTIVVPHSLLQCIVNVLCFVEAYTVHFCSLVTMAADAARHSK